MGKLISGSRIAVLAAVVACGWLAGTARAASFDFSGAFTADNDVLKFNFTVGAPSTVTIFSSSWIQGGFDPILSLWDSTGNLVAVQDDGNNTTGGVSNSVFYNTGIFDSYYDVNLAAGNYTVAITQYDNFPVDTILADGFFYDGPANTQFTNDVGFGSQPMFNGVFGPDDVRTGDWAFHIINVDDVVIVDPNPVPIPAALWTGLPMLAAMIGVRKWRSRTV